jgi:hypothetical protein
MNWLIPLTQKIRDKKEFPAAQREALVLLAAELSGICDTCMKSAPEPLVDSIDQWELLLRWEDEHDERELTIYVDPENLQSPSLHLRHWSLVSVTSRPTHHQLKCAVQAYFQQKETDPMTFQKYRRKQIAELRPYIEGENMAGVSVSAEDTKAGSPKAGDMIARNPKNHADQWLVAAQYFADNFEPVTPDA